MKSKVDNSSPFVYFYEKIIGGRSGLVCLITLSLLLFIVLPLSLNTFRLNLTGKYLSYAFVAMGLVMCWGYGGVLSLGQGLFFGIGGYCMAMFLKLEASDPESTKIQTTPGIPDFMDWNQVTELPWFWYPFKSLPLTLILILCLPTIVAFCMSFFYFKGRVGPVVFAILTQSMVACVWYLIVGNQGYFGGINGMTDLKTLNGWDIRTESAQVILYFVCVALLFLCLFFCRYILASRYGRVLVAQRDREQRVQFSGYNISNFKIFIFCAAAFVSGIGGAMFTLQVGFMSPNLIGVVPSIDMVIFTAVGGRLSLYGAAYGALLISFAKTALSEANADLWIFFYGSLFIIIVMLLPKGLAGLYTDHIKPRFLAWYYAKKGKPASGKEEGSSMPIESSPKLEEAEK
ncbi:MAG: urea ABC transporter permease subunit UrtC [Verrucomicrobiota bacterium]